MSTRLWLKIADIVALSPLPLLLPTGWIDQFIVGVTQEKVMLIYKQHMWPVTLWPHFASASISSPNPKNTG